MRFKLRELLGSGAVKLPFLRERDTEAASRDMRRRKLPVHLKRRRRARGMSLGHGRHDRRCGPSTDSDGLRHQLDDRGQPRAGAAVVGDPPHGARRRVHLPRGHLVLPPPPAEEAAGEVRREHESGHLYPGVRAQLALEACALGARLVRA